MWLKWHYIDYPITAQFCATPAVGAKLPIRDARYMVAFGGKADAALATDFGSD
jgi:hypothetical protein